MQTIKIKCSCDGSQILWTKIMTLLSNYVIRPLKLVPCFGGYIAHLNDIADCEKLLSDPVVKALQAMSCEPITPPIIRAKRTIVLHSVDSHILRDATSESLIEDLSRSNDWLTLDNVFKLKSQSSLKIVCDTHATAERCLREGLRLSYTFIPPRNISAETFIPISFCYKCYALDTHKAKDCPKPPDFKVCSLCSSQGHTFKECNSDSRRCVNCDGDHGTLSHSCPKRRDIVKRISAGDRKSVVLGSKSYATRSDKSYADAVQNFAAPNSHGATRCDLTRGTMCILLASFSESQRSGSFQECLSGLLAVNKLPSLELGTFCPLSMEETLREDLGNFLRSFSKLSELNDESKSANTVDVNNNATSAVNVSDATLPTQADSASLSDGSSYTAQSEESPFSDYVGTNSEVSMESSEVNCDERSSVPKSARSLRSNASELPSTSTSVGNRVPVSRTASIRDIKIFKCRGAKTVDSGNIRALVAAGKVFIECPTASEKRCLDILSKKGSQYNVAFSCVVELSPDAFIKRLSANVSGKKSTSR